MYLSQILAALTGRSAAISLLFSLFALTVGLSISGTVNANSQGLYALTAKSSSVNVASSKSSAAKAKASKVSAVGPVNLNTASADQIAERLVGVGPSKAQAIVKYREEVGHFRSLDEVLEVKGIGPSILKRNEARIVLSKPRS